LQLLPGIGPSTATKILDAADGQPKLSQVLSEFSVPKAAAQDWPAFTKLIAQLRKAKTGWPTEFESVSRWYEPHLLQIFDDGHIRAADLAQLEQIAAGFRSRQQFLTELTLDPPDATSGRAKEPLLDEDYVILSTIHSAKGLEWKYVHILNVVDGCIPSDMATDSEDEIEEERRLLHVAMTRTKDQLNLVVPQRFYTYKQSDFGDRHVYGSTSRFIPASIRQFFDCRMWAERDSEVRRVARSSTAPVDITARLKQRWA
jgi:DNA helicase-2/ATP-dependent DNA helicase PcrA